MKDNLLERLLSTGDLLGVVSLIDTYDDIKDDMRKLRDICLIKCGKYDSIQEGSYEAFVAQYLKGNSKSIFNELIESDDHPDKDRLLLMTSIAVGDTKWEMKIFDRMGEAFKDQMCLAAYHFKRNNFQGASDIYKKILLEDKEKTYLNVFIAMCYFKLDYYEVSLDIASPLAKEQSISAANICACNQYKLYGGAAALTSLEQYLQQSPTDLIAALPPLQQATFQHNFAIFDNKVNKDKLFMNLLDIIPEARLNLAIVYLKQEQPMKALELFQEKGFVPNAPIHYLILGIIHAQLSQQHNKRDKEHLSKAQKYFQAVGASSSECDTVPGRQAMASCFIILGQYEDANLYYSSIKNYLSSNDTFNYNYGVSFYHLERYQEALDYFNLIQDPSIREEPTLVSIISRCLISTGKNEAAWNECKKIADKEQVLQVAANDWYKESEFYFATNAFHRLEQVSNFTVQEYWIAMRGALSGAVEKWKEGRYSLKDINSLLQLLDESPRPEASKLKVILSRHVETTNERV